MSIYIYIYKTIKKSIISIISKYNKSYIRFYKLSHYRFVSNITLKNLSQNAVSANALGLTRITRADLIRIGHFELLVTISSLHVFFLLFLLTYLVDCYLCFFGLSFDARRDDGVPFCHRSFS